MQTIEQFFRDVFLPLKLRSKSAQTRLLYEIAIRHFARYLARTPLLSDLNDDTVSRHLAWFRTLPPHGRAPATTNKQRSSLLAMWRFAASRHLLDCWPTVEPEIEPLRVPQAWTAEEIGRLFAAVERLTGRVGRIPAAAWWRALLLVCWDTGERIGGVRGLRWRDVDLQSGYVVSPAEIRKGHRADRIYRLAPDTVESLRALRRGVTNPDEQVFVWPYFGNYIWEVYGRILRRAGLPHDSRSLFHRVRRTVASYCEAAGGNATELLGHSARSVTLAYLDPRIVGRQYAVDLLFRPGQKPNR